MGHDYRITRDHARPLRVGEVSRILGVASRTVHKLMDDGLLPGHRIPGSTDRRFRRSDVERFAREHRMADARPVVATYGLYPADSLALASDLEGTAEVVVAAAEPFALGCLVAERSPAVVVVDLGARPHDVTAAVVGHLAARVPAVVAFGPVAGTAGLAALDAIGVIYRGERPGMPRVALGVMALLLSGSAGMGPERPQEAARGALAAELAREASRGREAV